MTSGATAGVAKGSLQGEHITTAPNRMCCVAVPQPVWMKAGNASSLAPLSADVTDCSFTADRTFVLCHHARTQLVPRVDGENGYLFTGNTVDGRCGVFVLDEYERRQW